MPASPVVGPLPAHSAEFCPRPGICGAHRTAWPTVHTRKPCSICGGPRTVKKMTRRVQGRNVAVCTSCKETPSRPGKAPLFLQRSYRQGVPA